MSDHGTSEIRIVVDGAAAVTLDSPRQLAERLRTADVVRLTAAAGSVQARRSGAGWEIAVEGDRRRRGRTPNTDATYDLLRSWCNGDGWWIDAFGWG